MNKNNEIVNEPVLSKLFVKFTEHNDNEAESWNYWLQLDGNKKALSTLKDEIDALHEPWLRDTYKLNLTPVPEDEVNVLVKHSRSGYNMYENKVTGKFDFEIPTEKINEFYESKDEFYFEDWYKGGIADKFHD